MIRKGTGKPVKMTMRTMCARAGLHTRDRLLLEAVRGSFTQGFEPATLDLTDVKSKILPLSYGYWSKSLAPEAT